MYKLKKNLQIVPPSLPDEPLKIINPDNGNWFLIDKQQLEILRSIAQMSVPEASNKLEIKERMVSQFKASDKGFTENKVDGRGKIKLAKYFVYIEVYDFSVSEDEVVRVKGESKTTQTTRLGLQVKFVDAETGEVIVGSGLGEASTVKTISILDGIDEEGVKFNQSTIGITTKKALETASSRIVTRLIKKGVFKS